MSFRKNAFKYGFNIEFYKTFSPFTSQSTRSGRFSSLNRFEKRWFYSKQELLPIVNKFSLYESNRQVNQASSKGLLNTSINNSDMLSRRYHSSDSTPTNNTNEPENKSNLNAKEFLDQERRMNSQFVARQFLSTLNSNELALLKEELLKLEKETASAQSKGFFFFQSLVLTLI